ncbi:ABC transporter ATP-binding protein [Bradyrhizobium sp. U531]|uniref:ABC transporter ATP-binding protein n=1 Tax=Bradyrhizobium sp. U531 TaxID=3053458 RepID=UPI003F43407F
MGTMIALDSVCKKYGDFIALKPTSFEIREGEFLTLLGPSGSGKTTILNLTAGSATPTTGRIMLGGRDVTNVSARDRNIGMVFQNYALMPHMTVFDNIAYPLVIRRLPSKEIKAKVYDVIERVGLKGFESRKPRQLSGGQQQRVGIARCIVYSPKIILMDEPLGALDKNMRDQMQEEIKRLHKELGTTIIYVTHDQEEALNLSDTVCLMNQGSVVQIGPPQELYYAPTHQFAAEFLGESNILEATPTETERLLRTVDGLLIRLPAPPVGGGPFKILIRPEKLRPVKPEAQADEPNVVRGTVEFKSFFGGMTRLTLRTANGSLFHAKRISERGAADAKPGDPLAFTWAESDMVLLKA